MLQTEVGGQLLDICMPNSDRRFAPYCEIPFRPHGVQSPTTKLSFLTYCRWLRTIQRGWGAYGSATMQI
jgi:hypothetical protein